MSAKRFLLAVFAAVLVVPAMAQQMEIPSTEPVQKLSWLVGEWTSKDKMMDMTGASVESDGSASSKFVLKGRYVSFNTKMSMGPMGDAEGQLMMTFNELKNRYEATWFDSTSGQAIPFAGSLEGDKLTLTSEAIEYPEIGALRFRATYTKASATQVKMTLDIEMGGQWMTQVESTYTKK